MSLAETVINSFLNRHFAKPDLPPTRQGDRNLAKGLLAGLIAGIAATAAKTAVEKLYPPRTNGEPEPPEVLANKVAGHELAPAPKKAASEVIHWGFGAAAGAAYGGLAEFYPAVTSRDGASFGMTLMGLTHESALPAMGLSAEPAAQTTREKTSEMASHIVFGIVAETTRRAVRKML